MKLLAVFCAAAVSLAIAAPAMADPHHPWHHPHHHPHHGILGVILPHGHHRHHDDHGHHDH